MQKEDEHILKTVNFVEHILNYKNMFRKMSYLVKAYSYFYWNSLV